MEAVGAIAAIAGIASFGLQLAQLLQKQIGDISDAEERVRDLVSEVQATSNNLDKIKYLLLSSNASTGDHSLNGQFREDLQSLTERCEAIFRDVVKLLAKAGAMALASVDGFLRPFRKNAQSTTKANTKLEIEFIQLSASDKALWSFRRPKIEQYITNLDRLKMELMLLLLMISLIRTGSASTGPNSPASIPLTDDATKLVDEIFYINQAIDASTSHVPRDEDATSSLDHKGDDDAISVMLGEMSLYLNWPHSSTTLVLDPPTLQLLSEHRIFFEAYAVDMAGTTHEYTKLPLPSRELYETALDFARLNKGTISDQFARLSFLQQKVIGQTLLKIDPTHEEPQPESVVVAIESQGPQRRRSVLSKMKSLFGSEKLDYGTSCFRVTLMRSPRETDSVEEEDEEDELAEKSASAKHHGETAKAPSRTDAMSEAATPDTREPVLFKDAVGRKFSFPFKSCSTWGDMSELINQAFLHVEVIGAHVQSGHYDLLDPDGYIILPSIWEDTVQPGWTISQQMWPLAPESESEAQPKPKPPPRPPPPPNSESTQLFQFNQGKKKKSRAKSKKTGRQPELMERELSSNVARIADYKSREADTFRGKDELQEAMAPSDDAKKAVAQYYLEKWTT